MQPFARKVRSHMTHATVPKRNPAERIKTFGQAEAQTAKCCYRD